MWVFTKHGFFSAVCARQGSGKHGQPVDPNRIMIRARVRAHLEALQVTVHPAGTSDGQVCPARWARRASCK